MNPYEDNYHQWSLQMAIACTHHEFHDKSLSIYVVTSLQGLITTLQGKCVSTVFEHYNL